MWRLYRSGKPHRVEVFRSTRITHTSIIQIPTHAISTWMIQITYISFGVLRYPLGKVIHAPWTPRHTRASKTRLLLYELSNNTVTHDSFYAEIILSQKRGGKVLPAPPFQTYDTPNFMPLTSRVGTLYVYIYIRLVCGLRFFVDIYYKFRLRLSSWCYALWLFWLFNGESFTHIHVAYLAVVALTLVVIKGYELGPVQWDDGHTGAPHILSKITGPHRRKL